MESADAQGLFTRRDGPVIGLKIRLRSEERTRLSVEYNKSLNLNWIRASNERVAFGADEYTSALPIQAVMDPTTLVVYEMKGNALSYEHGYPASLLVPNRYGMKDPKWLSGLRLMTREYEDWYGQRNWSKTAVVQTTCRIDTPRPN